MKKDNEKLLGFALAGASIVSGPTLFLMLLHKWSSAVEGKSTTLLQNFEAVWSTSVLISGLVVVLAAGLVSVTMLFDE